jgi:hypothetical protein
LGVDKTVLVWYLCRSEAPLSAVSMQHNLSPILGDSRRGQALCETQTVWFAASMLTAANVTVAKTDDLDTLMAKSEPDGSDCSQPQLNSTVPIGEDDRIQACNSYAET